MKLKSLSILSQYSIIFIDLYGVIRDAKGLFFGVADTLERLMSDGRIIFLVSNTTDPSSIMIKNYLEFGLIQGVHYAQFITSGEIVKELLSNGLINFKSSPSPKKYTIFGTPKNELFRNAPYIEVSPEEADFVYISIPQLTEEEKIGLLPSQQQFTKRAPRRVPPLFNSISLEPFVKKIASLVELGLPALVANPDEIACEVDHDTGVPYFVIRQGAIGREYSRLGGEVFWIGKPHIEIFESCFKILKSNYGINVAKERIAIVGDTLETDIKGAQNVSRSGYRFQGEEVTIDSILTLSGVSALDAVKKTPQIPLLNDELSSLKLLFQSTDIYPTHVILSLGEDKFHHSFLTDDGLNRAESVADAT